MFSTKDWICAVLVKVVLTSVEWQVNTSLGRIAGIMISGLDNEQNL